MSSHHFVRDKQEPSILIWDEHSLSEELMGQLFEWSPVIMCHERALAYLSSLEGRIDVIFHEKFLEEELAILTRGLPCEFVRLDPEQALEQAMRYITGKQHDALNILGLKPEEIQTLLAYAGQINMIFFDQNHKIYPVKELFKKWMMKGQEFSLSGEARIDPPLQATHVSAEKIDYTVAQDGLITIRSDGPYILVSEKLD